jgi:hypothetical protein
MWLSHYSCDDKASGELSPRILRTRQDGSSTEQVEQLLINNNTMTSGDTGRTCLNNAHILALPYSEIYGLLYACFLGLVVFNLYE